MGTTRKTITITDQQDEWIKAQIEGGDFTNDSEYIRDLFKEEIAVKHASKKPAEYRLTPEA